MISFELNTITFMIFVFLGGVGEGAIVCRDVVGLLYL